MQQKFLYHAGGFLFVLLAWWRGGGVFWIFVLVGKLVIFLCFVLGFFGLGGLAVSKYRLTFVVREKQYCATV